jgi:hypothetical protein
MMPVALASIGKGASIAVLSIAVEYARWLAFFSDALTAQIAQVRGKRR